MIFLDEHTPSIPAKILMAFGVLSGSLLAVILTTGYSDGLMSALRFDKVEGNFARQVIMFICCFLYFIRFSIGLFVFMQRKISWLEGGLVTFLFFMMFFYFGISAGSHPTPIGILDIVGVGLFLFGSCINTLADYQRFVWKKHPKNQGQLYTAGLFRYAMHINYFGDTVAYLGLSLMTYHSGCVSIVLGLVVYFIVFEIPRLDAYLSKKYTIQFKEYATATHKFVPFIY